MKRTIVISREPDPTQREIPDASLIWMRCEDFKELDKYIATAQRMRPDRIIIEYEEYLGRQKNGTVY